LSKSRRKKPRNTTPSVKDSKTALDALKELKKLQNSRQTKQMQTATFASSGKTERSVGSSDLPQDEITGGGLQWFEKLHDEKINTVEARLGAQTTGMVMGIKSELEGQISGIRESNSRHVTSIIVSIFIAFIVFYFAALSSIEDKVESRVIKKIDSVSDQVAELDEKVEEKIKGLTKKIQATLKSDAPDL